MSQLGTIAHWQNRVIGWARERNILGDSSAERQFEKLEEEVQELSDAISEVDKELAADAIGDCAVVLCIISEQMGLDFDACLEVAWNEIKDRKGRMENGKFVKEQS